MIDAIAILKEIIFKPINPPANLSPVDRMAYFGEMGLRRESALNILHNFLSLAQLEPRREQAQELQKKRAWETVDRTAGEQELLNRFYDGHPPPLEPAVGGGLTGATGEHVLPVSETPQPPPQE